MIARFGAFELDLHARELRKSGVRVHVPPQSVEILAALIERSGEVVARDEIRERLWPHGTIVEFEHSVNAAMKRLRDALCDSADTPRFIETLPRYGYRFLVSVEKHEPATDHGHFRILGEAGRGAMGIVYRAEDIQLGRTVALKVLPDELSEHPPALEQLRREARIAASLNHPGICTLYGIDQHDGHFCLVMEYLEGQPLSRMLEGGPLGLDHALRVGIQVAEALEAAHSRGIIHGDIKPSNLFLTSSGQVKVMDFGIATRTGDGAFPVRGTPGYMSPEQAEGKPVDQRSDVFALGCVLFEMITRRRASPVSDSEAMDGLGPELQPVLIRCLQREPDARFQTMSELKCALQEIKEATKQRSSPLAPAKTRSQRSRRWILGVVLTALLATAAAGWWWTSRKSTAFAPPLTPTLVTSYPGVEEDATLSPDGSQVAFSANIEDPNNFDIYVKVIGSEPPVRLTRDPKPDTGLVWSPDGRWIAFIRGDQLLLVSPLGGPERIVSENLAADPVYGPVVTWSPDSRNVISAIQTAPLQPPAIFAISIATGERRILNWPHAAGRWVTVLSPGGHKLAFLRIDPNQVAGPGAFPIPHLYVAELSPTLEVGQPRPVDWGTPARVGGCAWTAGERDLICALPLPDSRMALWRIDTERGAPLQVLPYTEDAWGPVTAGRRLVFERFKYDFDIWRAGNPDERVADPAPVRLIASTAPDIQPHYAPDGKNIAFFSSRSGQLEVWVTNADSSGPRMLTSLAAVGRDTPQWSRDGKSILFTNDNNIYVIDAAGGVPKRLVSNPVLKVSSPSYSHDGKWIYFCSEYTARPEVWRMPAAGGSAAPITKNGGMEPLESPDGQYLLFVRQDSKEFSLWRMPSSGGTENLVLQRLGIIRWGCAFAAGRLSCIRSDNPDDPMAVDVIDPASGAIRQVRTLNAPQRFGGQGLSVSPDGRWFLYTAGVAQGDLVQFENFR